MSQVTFKINDENVDPSASMKRKLKGTPHPKKKARSRFELADPGISSTPATSPAPHSQMITELTTTEQMWKENIEDVYREYNPAKFDNIPALMEKYRGNLPTLWAKICKTYGVNAEMYAKNHKFVNGCGGQQDEHVVADKFEKVAALHVEAEEYDQQSCNDNDQFAKWAAEARKSASDYEKEHGLVPHENVATATKVVARWRKQAELEDQWSRSHLAISEEKSEFRRRMANLLEKRIAVESFVKSQDRRLSPSSVAEVALEWRQKAHDFEERAGLDPNDVNAKKAFLFRELAKSIEKHHGVKSNGTQSKPSKNEGFGGFPKRETFPPRRKTFDGLDSSAIRALKDANGWAREFPEFAARSVAAPIGDADAPESNFKRVLKETKLKSTKTPAKFSATPAKFSSRSSAAPMGDVIFGTPGGGLGSLAAGLGSRNGFGGFAAGGGFGAKPVFGTKRNAADAFKGAPEDIHSVSPATNLVLGSPVFGTPSAVRAVVPGFGDSKRFALDFDAEEACGTAGKVNLEKSQFGTMNSGNVGTKPNLKRPAPAGFVKGQESTNVPAGDTASSSSKDVLKANGPDDAQPRGPDPKGFTKVRKVLPTKGKNDTSVSKADAPKIPTKTEANPKMIHVEVAGLKDEELTDHEYVWHCVESGKLDLLKAYCPADFDFLQLDARQDSKGITILHALFRKYVIIQNTENEYISMAKWLMERGADPAQKAASTCTYWSGCTYGTPQGFEGNLKVYHAGRSTISSLLCFIQAIKDSIAKFNAACLKDDGKPLVHHLDLLSETDRLFHEKMVRAEKLLDVFSGHAASIAKPIKSLAISEGVVEAWERFRGENGAKDVTICAKNSNQEVKAHSIFLVAASSVLKLMLNGAFSESKDKVISVDDELAPNTLTLFIDLLYCGSSSLDHRTCATILHVFDLAHRWQIGYVCEICERWLIEMMDTTNVEEIAKMALMKGIDSLELACRRYVESNMDSFIDLPTTLKELIKSENASEPSKKKRRC